MLFNSYGHQVWDILCIVGLGLTDVSKGLCNGNNGNIPVWADSDSIFQYLMIIVVNGYENTFLLVLLKDIIQHEKYR